MFYSLQTSYRINAGVHVCKETKNKLIGTSNAASPMLTFTTLWAFSADDKLMIYFLFFPENRIRHFMQIVSSGDNLHEMSYPVSEKNKKKIFQNAVCWKFYPEC